ncbi:MAG: uroporphyrinogen-III synthase [Gillisia sp.]
MHTVLSTKMLSQAQKNLLLNAGIALVEYNAIKIEARDFICEEVISNGIITSQNAANIIINRKIKIENVFCVGEKTAALLKDHGFNIAEISNYGKDLAEILSTGYSNRNFTFFCGDKRRDDIPLILKEKSIEVREIEVYKTKLVPKEFNQKFDGILFFSPSAVQSFMMANHPGESLVFCIGTTTAAEAENFTQNILIATKPSIENVIVQVVKKFRI